MNRGEIERLLNELESISREYGEEANEYYNNISPDLKVTKRKAKVMGKNYRILKEVKSKIADDIQALIREDRNTLINNIQKDVLNGIEYNKANYGRDEITDIQIMAYLRYWRQKGENKQ